ncbi:MAG: M20/M25/M40 family metallo-hydrolase [Clostridia bacterium]|nr:M20/M25/M40 family metallo-hydrolase [Clostridia bacterium]
MNIKDLVPGAEGKIKDLAKFSVDNIAHLVGTYGPRPCGEKGETDAQLDMLETLKGLADEAYRDTFKVNPDAFMAFVPLAGTCLIGATATSLGAAFTGKKALNAVTGSLVGAALSAVVGEFVLYKEFLDPFFKEKTSGNVYGIRKASGETKKRIIVSGHTDSAPEWVYTYKLGSKGVVIVAGYAVVGLVATIGATVASLVKPDLAKKLALAELAFLPAYGLLYRFTDSKHYVPGASDDLSGSMVAMSVMKFLKENDVRFEDTDVITLLTGGEECGLRGAKAFFKQHPDLVTDNVETAYIGFDTVRDMDFMEIYTGDMSGVVKNDKQVAKLLQNGAKDCGLDVGTGSIPLGSTDAAAASQAGVKASCFVAMDPAPARYYHTRLDTVDNLCEDTIEKGINIALNAVATFADEGLPQA